MSVWQAVHDWSWVSRSCATLTGAPDEEFREGKWQSRQMVSILARFSTCGFGPPCGTWQAVQPSVFTTACSYTKGPAISVWHFVQMMSSCEEDL